MNTENINQKFIVAENLTGLRCDQALVQLLPEYSRAQLQVWIKSGEITVDGTIKKPKDKLKLGQIILINASLPVKVEDQAQQIPLDIIYEDDAILVLNKSASFVVHPGAGVASGTLLNALLHHAPSLNVLPRAGIVHRLDKDTTGIMVVAKTNEAYHALVKQIKARTVKRTYHALVTGLPISSGKIDASIGRHKTQRTKMAVIESGKQSITHYKILKKFAHFSLLQVCLETGRTHQIRVHMAYIKHPLVADPTYGNKNSIRGVNLKLIEHCKQFARQALHAYELAFIHPATLKSVNFIAPYSNDFQKLIKLVEELDNATD